MRPTVDILGMGVITPLSVDLPGMGPACSRKGPVAKETREVPVPEGMTARDQRRLAHLTRMALYAADQAAAVAGIRGRDAGIYVGMTHGTSTFLKEFHDYLFDYGPEMASPNAFSNGVTNAPLGAISMHQGLTQGGATLVGFENCGMEVMHHAAHKILDGTHDLCYAGTSEEYAAIVEDVYLRLGWYNGRTPQVLPNPFDNNAPGGFAVSEGSVFAVLGKRCSEESGDGGLPRCSFTPVDDVLAFGESVDLIVSGAGGGPVDQFELEALQEVLTKQSSPVPLLFTKPFLGETFAVGPMLSAAVAWDIMTNGSTYLLSPVHEQLRAMASETLDPAAVSSALVVCAGREGQVSAGLLTRRGRS